MSIILKKVFMCYHRDKHKYFFKSMVQYPGHLHFYSLEILEIQQQQSGFRFLPTITLLYFSIGLFKGWGSG